MRNAAHDSLSIELQHEAQNAVRGGMLRANVDEHVLTLEIRLETWWRLDGDRRSTVVRYERNALWPSLRVETRCRELYFDCVL